VHGETINMFPDVRGCYVCDTHGTIYIEKQFMMV
jgi:hypothetical protein